MGKIALVVVALVLTNANWCAGQEKKDARSVPGGRPVTLTEQMRRVEDQLKDQREQMGRQREQIEQQQAAIGQLEQLLTQATLELREQGQQLQKAMQQSTNTELAGSSAGSAFNASAKNVEQKLQETKKSLDGLEHPQAIRYKGVTLTPGGYLAAQLLVRSRNENADVTSNFGAIPFDGVANAHLSEFRSSSRSSRITLLAEGTTGATKLTGYYELDFLAQAPTGNQVQTNSFSPRQRQLWAQAEFSNGLTFTAGQFWSLITPGRKGLAIRAELIPNTLDGSYVVGYNYVRQTAFRLTKNLNNRVWGAIEIANPETNQPNASYVPPNLFGFNNSGNAGSPNGSTLNYLAGSTNGFSTNLAPDLLAKVAWEPGWGHYEVKLLGRFFRDRINGANNLSYGGGVGVGAILPVVRNKVDFLSDVLVGSGIGRYGAGNGSDVTLRPDGAIIPIHSFHALVGLEIHPQDRLDMFVYGGDEYYGRAAYVDPTNSTKPAGYGSPLVDNRNCGVEVVPTGGAACGAQNRNVGEGTAGFWYRIYKGPFGTAQYGVQYEYLFRSAWSGQGGAPQGVAHMVQTTFRYILP